MTFAHPAALWGLLATVPVVALHILRSRRVQLVVSSVLGWDRIDRPAVATKPWQRLRWTIPLVLQLLVVAGICAALAGPGRDSGRRSAEQLIVLADTSASMGATDARANRVDEVRRIAERLIDDVGGEVTVSIIATGAPARIVASGLQASQAGAALGELRAGEGPFDAAGTGALARSLDRPDRSADVVLISDGGLDGRAIAQLPPGTRLDPVGSGERNVGITNVVVAPRGTAAHVTATVTNSWDRAEVVPVRIDVDGRTALTRSVKVAARSAAEVGADVPSGERIDVLADIDDLLTLDNHAYGVGPSASRLDVVLVGPDDPFLDALTGVRTDLAVQRLASPTAPEAAAVLAEADLVIYNQVAVPESPTVPYVAIAPPGGTRAVAAGATLDDPIATLVRSDTELLDGLDLAGLAFADSQRLDAPGATTLIGSEATPLVVSGRDAAVPFVYLGTPLSHTNFGLLPAFAVFGDRVLTSLGRPDLAAGSLVVGDPLPIESGAKATVVSPAGTRTAVEPGMSPPELDRTGIWTVEIAGQGSRLVVVNPAPAESDVRPVARLAIPGVASGLQGDEVVVNDDLTPWLLAALLAVVAAEWWWSRRRRGVSRRQWRWAAIGRGAVAAAIVAAILAPTLTFDADEVAVVFVVDLSDSVGGGTRAGERFVGDALAAAPDGSVAGVVAVGAQARVDASVAEHLAWAGSTAVIDRSDTDLASGLRVAAAMLPTDHARRIVLVSDGRPTLGDTAAEVARLRRDGVRLDVHVVAPASGADVAVGSVRAPQVARPGETATIEADLVATAAQLVTVTLRRNDQPVDRRAVEVTAGTTTVSFTQPIDDSAQQRWEVLVSGPDNGRTQNDAGRATTRVAGRARVLLVEGVPDNAASVAAALAATGADVATADPTTLGGLNDLSAFDAIGLVDVPAASLSSAQTAQLDTAVRELGVGLVAIGGTSSFGAGDYLGSPLENLLPVVSEVPDDQRRSRVAQVFAVDVSGSMGACHCSEEGIGANARLPGGVEKTDIARDAAVKALAGMAPTDELGVLALDDRNRWLLDVSLVGSGATARRRMGGIEQTGRATSLGTSLQAAAAQLDKAQGTVRHVVLFTDGFTSGEALTGLTAQAAQLRDSGITVSVMGTGEGAAQQLRQIAEAGGGRYYPGRDLQLLPDLLLQETKVVSRQLIVEGEVVPVRTSVDPMVASLDAAPPLRGYLATTARPTAATHLQVGEHDDPLLASWRVGLGTVAAWTSDAGRRWSAPWAAWDGNPEFWSGVFRATFPHPAGAARLSFADGEGRVEAVFDDDVPDGAAVEGRVTDPSGEVSTVRLERIDGRRFAGAVPAGRAGSYAVGVTATLDGAAIAAVSATADSGFSREYLDRGADGESMRAWSALTRGRGDVTAGRAFDATGLRSGRRVFDLRPWLLWAALLAWPLVVALSRLSFVRGTDAIARPTRPAQLEALAARLSGARRATPSDALAGGVAPRVPDGRDAGAAPRVPDGREAGAAPRVPDGGVAPRVPDGRDGGAATGSNLDSLLRARRARGAGGSGGSDRSDGSARPGTSGDHSSD